MNENTNLLVRVSILIGKVEIHFKCTILSAVQCSDATKVSQCSTLVVWFPVLIHHSAAAVIPKCIM